MTKYMLILRSDIEFDYSGFSPDDMQKVLEGYESWAGKLAAENRLKVGHKLTDGEGRVMLADGVTTKDGPYVETKEVVGGYYIIDAENYDHAVELCKEHPNFRFGSIEIREVDFMGGPEDI